MRIFVCSWWEEVIWLKLLKLSYWGEGDESNSWCREVLNVFFSLWRFDDFHLGDKLLLEWRWEEHIQIVLCMRLEDGQDGWVERGRGGLGTWISRGKRGWAGFGSLPNGCQQTTVVLSDVVLFLDIIGSSSLSLTSAFFCVGLVLTGFFPVRSQGRVKCMTYHFFLWMENLCWKDSFSFTYSGYSRDLQLDSHCVTLVDVLILELVKMASGRQTWWPFWACQAWADTLGVEVGTYLN